MASSALYRYVASRDDLLTLLIVQIYDELGAVAEACEAECADADVSTRWLTLCHAVRGWAVAHPHDYALLYGTPVPGYAAPAATIPPAPPVPYPHLDVSKIQGSASPRPHASSPQGRKGR